MTSNDQITEQADEQAEGTAQSAEPSEGTQEPRTPAVDLSSNEVEGTDDDAGNGGRAAKDAKKYRLQLRDTEAERDTLRGQVDTLRRREAENIAGAVLRNAAGLWAAGVTVDDLLDDDGNIDRDTVMQRAREAAETVGLQINSPKPDPTQGGHGIPVHNDAMRWTEAMRH